MMDQTELLLNKEIKLRNRDTYIVGFGYNDADHESGKRDDDGGFLSEAQSITKYLSNILQPKESVGVWNEDSTKSQVLDAIQKVSDYAGAEDTLLVYYSGHGEPDDLRLPLKGNPNSEDLDSLPKADFFEALEAFKGRKIVFLSCCHSDYDKIPPNTLLVTPSKRETPAITSSFGIKLARDISDIQRDPELIQDPLSALVQRLLTDYQNYPYSSLEDVSYLDSDKNPVTVYREEKKQGHAILNNYQRGSVRSTLVEDMLPIAVSQSCNFI